MIVEHALTPIPADDLRGIIDAAFHQLFGWCPGLDASAVLAAQIAQEHGLETTPAGRWVRGVWGNNIGNHDAGITLAQATAAPEPYFRTVAECEGLTCERRAVHLRAAYASPEEGMVALLETLQRSYPAAFYALPAGPDAFVAGLHEGGYFTGSPTAYAAGVLWLTHDFLRRWSADDARPS